MNALELHHVNKAYPGFSLQDINLTLPAGSIMGLVGENGAGKSTLIRVLMNATNRDSGEVYVLGRDNRNGFNQTKEEIGVVLDEAYYPETITARQLNKVLQNSYQNWNGEQYHQLLRKFSLPESKPFKEYSRGMKMKLAIAAALSHNPKLLVLDEATSGLDPIVRDEILDLFYDFTRDETHSILISSHIVSDLEKLCDYIAFLHRGKLIFCEEKDALSDVYGIIRCNAQGLEVIPPEAICGQRRSEYGIEVLVKQALVSPALRPERADVEEIMLLLSKQ